MLHHTEIDKVEQVTMHIMLNGQETDTQATTLAALLQELKLDSTKVAIEQNRHIIHKQNYAHAALTPGDHIEIVAFIGGG